MGATRRQTAVGCGTATKAGAVGAALCPGEGRGGAFTSVRREPTVKLHSEGADLIEGVRGKVVGRTGVSAE